MHLKKSRSISKAQYHRMHRLIYHKLHKEAFDKFFICNTPGCNSHTDLCIHYNVYDPDNWDNPDNYEILCEKCHKKKHRRSRSPFT